MRPFALAVVACLASPAPADAHIFTFDFVSPSGIGTRFSDGGAVLQWVDGADPNGLADLTFFASRNGLAPFLPAPKDLAIGAPHLPFNDPANLLFWDATGVSPGCYQPFAEVTDQIEGLSIRRSAGLFTLDPLDGGNAPPAVWFLNTPLEQAQPDGGAFAARLKIVDPDDRGVLAIRWSDGADAGGVLVSGLPIADGGGTVTYAFSTRTLPPASGYYLQAEVTGFDGQRCEVWWVGHLEGPSPAGDGGTDGGVDAGTADAGPKPPDVPRGCGCGAAGPGLALLGLHVWRRRSSRWRSQAASTR